MKRMSLKAIAMCGIVLLTVSGFANAGFVRATWDGEVLSATAGNAFGVASGDLVSGYAVFNTKWLGVPPGAPPSFITINHNFDPLFQMGVSIGSRTFVETEDYSWMNAPFSLPSLVFFDDSSLAALEGSWGGMFFNTCPVVGMGGIDCSSSTGLAFSPDLSFTNPYGWTVHDNGNPVAGGQWLSTSITLQSIPIPAVLPLMIGGLIALFGVARRRCS